MTEKVVHGIGHNNGPTMEPGHRWRTHQWRSAQRALMRKTIPLSIVRMRMKRAQELGMDYKTYAKVRQASGQDILALMFSSNALRIIGQGAKMPEAREAALQKVRNAKKLSLVYPPNTPKSVLAANRTIDAADFAPLFHEDWSTMRNKVAGLMQSQKLSGSAVLVIGDAPLENEWYTAGKAAGYLHASEYF
ncbi:hypothetical protein [Cognatishimia activa]|uniref:Uncharacterized protein n=1 Tax=Cognatishimia activa TaxID=1715691 RepID=A0A0P1IN00_9RHOB|nr:hypothetical protein [Cognatishimia activa]CUJ15014.1 hypothetical protein TA5113_02453 [Cognatishimia activa]CUK25014.1 hypothetical protein TA5114_00804 [Cognatishimia activa]